ncbi:CaiB/BaiF CoA transferase family protein [Moraxella ovis]|uniref:CaiB/BaiF CoA transferase family protein n=1 Tax=Moraxella ovis TaxID=29433 RepID=UPI000D832D73|nr:CaiB/BaiF CoA-transferase family protein [Moraxella ovis]SPX81061.1 Formyl-coenzyme A transferase [Moraxella ovis]STZ05961.1 Formyl-coenzyme A transferase [Moraxella ovis]
MHALQGIKVLDLSRVLAGPWCSQILADLGADVIKVERPCYGDDTRTWGPPWMPDNQGNQTRESGYFQCTNRNKRSIAIDITHPQGQALIHDIVNDVDVVIENHKVDSLKKYSLDYDSLRQINPRLVYCSITGFGQDGPRADEPGYDFIIQGMSGLMSVTGESDDVAGGGPQKVGVALVDIQTGLYATIAIQAALLARTHTQQGQHIDISLLDVQVATLANQGMNYLSSGNVPKRMGNKHPNIVPYQTFKAKDKSFIIACGNDKQFVDLCLAVGLPELVSADKYLKNQDRVKHRDELIEQLSAHFLTQNAEHWVDRIHAAKVPVGLINNIEEALNEPQIHHRGMVVNIPHNLNKDFKVIGSPVRLSGTPVTYRLAPPQLGEHTFEVLASFCDQDQLHSLQEQGIIENLRKD